MIRRFLRLVSVIVFIAAVCALRCGEAGAQSPEPAASSSAGSSAKAAGTPSPLHFSTTFGKPAAVPSAAPSGGPGAAPSSAPVVPATGPTPIPISIVVEKAESTRSTLEKMRVELGEDTELNGIESELRLLRENIRLFHGHVEETTRRDPSFDTVQVLIVDLRSMCANLEVWQRALTARLTLLDADKQKLSQMAVLWQVTLRSMLDGSAPSDVLDNVRSVCLLISNTQEQAEKWMRHTLSMQNQLSETDSLYEDLSSRLLSNSRQAAKRLLVRDTMPIWGSGAFSVEGGLNQVWLAMASRVDLIVTYAITHRQSLFGHAVVILFLFLLTRFAQRAFDREDVSGSTTLAAVRNPLATAVIMSLLAVAALYPAPPRLFSFLFMVMGLVSAIVVVRPVLDTRLHVALYLLIGSSTFDVMRNLTLSAMGAFRFVLTIEQLMLICFAIWLLRSGRLEAVKPTQPSAVRFLRTMTWYLLLGVSCATAANVTGLTNLSRYLMNLAIAPVYLGFLFSVALVLLDTLVLYVTMVPPLVRLGAVVHHRKSLIKGTHYLFGVMALLLWLRQLVLQTPLEGAVEGALRRWAQTDLWWTGITPITIVLFVLTLTAAFVCSKVILALLHHDVYPRLSLPNGVPFAISTVLHYVMVLVGFLLALGALGVDMTRFTLLASAFGVGLGFGLQTIVNNLVSGLILLFERPVKIGDVIEMGSNRGVLTHIGLRASVLHASDGSDIILPNGTLLSANVVNYTFADQQRRLEIEVQIPNGYDAQAVMDLLVSEASKVENIISDPAPACLFIKFTDKALILQVRAWVASAEHWGATRTALNLAVYGTLLREGLISALPLPSQKAALEAEASASSADAGPPAADAMPGASPETKSK
ncbi:MAG: hypothetical protein EB084_05110 [Proteobacteria bacterium]|nr:hypothetical protein [Pseudomonadota bacterium]